MYKLVLRRINSQILFYTGENETTNIRVTLPGPMDEVHVIKEEDKNTTSSPLFFCLV